MVVWAQSTSEVRVFVRRLAPVFVSAYLLLALPATALAATPPKSDAPSGTDHTLTTIFLIALGIPLVLAILTLIDIAVGREHGEDGH
jgi:hypothetical protein